MGEYLTSLQNRGGRFFECFHNANVTPQCGKKMYSACSDQRFRSQVLSVSCVRKAAFDEVYNTKFLTSDMCFSNSTRSSLQYGRSFNFEIGPLKVGGGRSFEGGRTFPETMAPACGPNNHEKSSFPVCSWLV